jgi:TatD DNase family protein
MNIEYHRPVELRNQPASLLCSSGSIITSLTQPIVKDIPTLDQKPTPPQLPTGISAIDTHCHLDMSAYNADCDQVVDAAYDLGVTRIITIGINIESSKKAVALADRYPGVYAAVGIHPHNAGEPSDDTWKHELKKLASHPKVVAYGEVGLDFVKKYAPVNKQLESFKQQVQTAKELNLPLIIHDREAHSETMDILKKERPYPAGGVVHCFSGDMRLAEAVLDLDFHISIPGIVTYNNAQTLQEVVKRMPLTSLLLETDGPFLAPVPERGKRNEPAFLLYTAAKIAEIKKLTLAEIARQTTRNAERLFNLP